MIQRRRYLSFAPESLEDQLGVHSSLYEFYSDGLIEFAISTRGTRSLQRMKLSSGPIGAPTSGAAAMTLTPTRTAKMIRPLKPASQLPEAGKKSLHLARLPVRNEHQKARACEQAAGDRHSRNRNASAPQQVPVCGSFLSLVESRVALVG